MATNVKQDQTRLAEVAEADQLMAALCEVFFPEPERRKAPRARYQVRARLERVTETDDTPTLHTRDLDPSGSGFVTRQPLGENDRGVLCLPAPDGKVRRIPCRVVRSRDVGDGWYEGSVVFDNEQPVFSHTRIRAKFD